MNGIIGLHLSVSSASRSASGGRALGVVAETRRIEAGDRTGMNADAEAAKSTLVRRRRTTVTMMALFFR